jgi:hypothetical protein
LEIPFAPFGASPYSYWITNKHNRYSFQRISVHRRPEFPQLTYYVYPVRAAVLQTGQASKLAATFDNQPVQSDITVAQVALWNEGRRAIKRTDVLKPIVISTENNVPILEATVRKSTRDVIQLSLNTDELQRGRVTVNWAILEQNDGGFVQLIYAGNQQVRIQVEGVVEGQTTLKSVEFTGTIKSPAEQYESERRSSNASYFFAFGFVFAGAAFGIRKARTDRRLAISAASKSLKDAQHSLEHTYQQTLDWEKGQRDQYLKWIAEYEGKQGFDAYVADYKKKAEDTQAVIEDYEKKLADAIANRHEFRNNRKQERSYVIGFVTMILLALIAFSLGLYSLFVARWFGPPFGF